MNDDYNFNLDADTFPRTIVSWQDVDTRPYPPTPVISNQEVLEAITKLGKGIDILIGEVQKLNKRLDVIEKSVLTLSNDDRYWDE